MIDGFYGLYYTGHAGSGFGVIVMHAGGIHGVDVTGGVFSGHYKIEAELVVGEVSLQVPASTPLVTGGPPQPNPYSFAIPLRLPLNLGGGTPLLVQTPTGPVNVSIKPLAPWKD